MIGSSKTIPEKVRRLKILVFTDSRGQHKPRGSTHKIFAERLTENPGFEVQSYLCPMKWTTTLDFLERFSARDLARYDYVVLYTGVVDWSPRKISSARNDLYNNPSFWNDENFSINTNDYEKKVVNNKKAIFDAVFGAKEMEAHFSSPFDVIFDGEPTINMYSLGQALEKLVPRLAAIKNLIFINSNRFIPGWEGDYKKTRPANIGITEDYSRAIRDLLPPERVIDLLQWDDRAVTEFTCDNLHLTAVGSDWIHDEIIDRIDRLERNACPAELMQDLHIDRSGDLTALEDFQGTILSLAATEIFLDARRGAGKTVQAGLSDKHADLAYLNAMSFLYGDTVCNEIMAANAQVKSDRELEILVGHLYGSEDQASSYIADRMARYRQRWRGEYRLLSLSRLNAFPYNYVSSYSFRAIERSTPPESLTVEFIYCIKNRRRRTGISVDSLIRSIRAYERDQKKTLSVRITVVEDVSPDIFDPNRLSAPDLLDHYIVDTGVGWTRSGLLNVGIRNSKADIIAFVVADFLFHEDYIKFLSEYLSLCDWKKQVIASNLIETEAHQKGNITYSALSPYSYMWLAPRIALREIGGFDEGYTGHGSEDRDLEMKLVRLCGLTVADTASIVPDCVVLHLSHNARDGYEQHQTNRQRYLERMAANPDSLRQSRWGEQDVIWGVRTSGDKPAHAKAVSLNSPLAPRRYATRSLSYAARGHSSNRTLYMIISCAAYGERRKLLERYYREAMPKNDTFIFIVGGAQSNSYDPVTRTLHLMVGDFYEHLPEKVLKAIAFCTENFDFAHLVKIDDDVVANFPLLTHIVKEIKSDYFGKMIPSRRGAKPSPTWHIGKVTERSPYFDKPFSFDGGPPNWCCGGMYAMSRRAAEVIRALPGNVDALAYLYEDHMLGCLLDQKDIKPVFIEEHEKLKRHRFIQTDLREVLDAPFEKILEKTVVDNAAGVHCGPFPPLYLVPGEQCLVLMDLFISHYRTNASSAT